MTTVGPQNQAKQARKTANQADLRQRLNLSPKSSRFSSRPAPISFDFARFLSFPLEAFPGTGSLRLLVAWLTALLRAMLAAWLQSPSQQWSLLEAHYLLYAAHVAEGPGLPRPKTIIALFTGNYIDLLKIRLRKRTILLIGAVYLQEILFTILLFAPSTFEI